MSGGLTIRLDHKTHYGIDEHGNEYTDVTVTHVYSPPIPGIRPFSQTIRYMKALNLVEIYELVKMSEAALKASVEGILGRAASSCPPGGGGFVEIDPPPESLLDTIPNQAYAG